MPEEQLFALVGRLYAQNQILAAQVRQLNQQADQYRAALADVPPDINVIEAPPPAPKKTRAKAADSAT